MICTLTCTHSLSLSFSFFPSLLTLPWFLSFSFCRSWWLSFTHTQIYMQLIFELGQGGGTQLRNMSRSVESKISWYLLIRKKLMFGKIYMYSNTHSLTRSQVYPHSKKCYMNTTFLRVRYQVQTTTDFLKVLFGAPSPSGYGGPNYLYQQCR